jgi:hypothetical protein
MMFRATGVNGRNVPGSINGNDIVFVIFVITITESRAAIEPAPPPSPVTPSYQPDDKADKKRE